MTGGEREPGAGATSSPPPDERAAADPPAPAGGDARGGRPALRGALSGVTLGLGGPTHGGAPSAPPARYDDGGLLGRGGMGEVRAAHDRLLVRTVALKAPLRGDPSAATRLIGEATLTAGLSHPGILPVLDAGELPDGRAYYTMPVIEGRSLAEALAEADGADERLRLVRHVLDAALAVAYAHSRGVLHRDLKPANVMVGPFGRTVVVDWGVAGRVGEPAVAADGRAIGTPGYMAPEQAACAALGPGADVFALGATLYAVVAGREPDRTGRGPWSAEAPAELRAIAARATSSSPGERYPTVAALADDLSAWFEGRRVAAHRYSLRELARRTWASSRSVIVVGGLAVVAVAAATAVGFWRTAAQRDVADAARGVAVAALAEAEAGLAVAQLAQAIRAARDGDQATTEVLAATSLLKRESPEGRGLLLAYDAAARPRRLRSWTLGGCALVGISADGDTVTSATADGVSIGSIQPDGSMVERRLTGFSNGVPIGRQGDVVVLRGETLLRVRPGAEPEPVAKVETRLFNPARSPVEGTLMWTGGGVVTLADVATGATWNRDVCAGVRSGARAQLRSDGTVLALCNDGAVMRSTMAPGAPVTRVLRVDPALGAPIQIGPVQGPDDPVFIHTSAGDVLVYDLRDGTLIRRFEAGDAPWRVITALGDRVVMRDQPGSARVFDWRTGRQVAVVPGVHGATGDAALLDGGDRLRLACGGVEDWALPSRNPPPMRWSTPAGIAGVAVSPDGSMFASAHGDGHLRVGRMDSPEWVVDLQLTPGVVKDVAFSPDGRRVAAALSGVQQLAWVDLDAPDVAHVLPSEGCSRVVWLRSGLYAASYERGLLWWADPTTGPPVRIGDAQVLDLDVARDGEGAVVAERGSGLRQLVESPTPHLVTIAPAVEAAIVAGDGGLAALRGDHGVQIARDGVVVATLADRGAHMISLQVSPDGRWLATGDTDGRLEIWSLSPVALRASWRGHDHRVTALAFDPTGRWLMSGSWDWEVARWSLDPLDTDPALLLTTLHAAWGRTADEVLDER